MDWENSAFWIWWKRYGEHIIAPMVLILLFLIWYQYFATNQLQKEININCGWGEEDYQCYCEKSAALRIKGLMEEVDLSDFNITPGGNND